MCKRDRRHPRRADAHAHREDSDAIRAEGGGDVGREKRGLGLVWIRHEEWVGNADSSTIALALAPFVDNRIGPSCRVSPAVGPPRSDPAAIRRRSGGRRTRRAGVV
ncbi:MAG: hypothetical protein AB7W59_13740, partial [Acidimicrobiia bacterium]